MGTRMPYLPSQETVSFATTARHQHAVGVGCTRRADCAKMLVGLGFRV